ncbi:hypothetical protein CPC08DRAFT_212828 [Agrocybe pediades]|nr:hypothetical protein CPC08DRAFT_212828 [Agrocybe pediades]
MPTTNVARLYHPVASLTPLGSILIAGSNPNDEWDNIRNRISSGIPLSTIHVHGKAASIKVSLIDLGFSSHAFHSSSRLVFMEARLSRPKEALGSSPPNNRVYPPGPGYIFLTVGDMTTLTSTGTHCDGWQWAPTACC